MKSFAQLFVCFIVVFNLIVGLHAGLFFVRNGVLYCKLSTRGSCDKVTPTCVKITATANTCKYYKNECQYEIDRCLSKTQFGRLGAITAATDCMAITVGQTGTC